MLLVILLLLCLTVIGCKGDDKTADNQGTSISKDSDLKEVDKNQGNVGEKEKEEDDKLITPLPEFDGIKINQSTIIGLGNTPGNHANGGFLCESDGWLYYADYNNGGYLCRKKLDGTEKQILVEEKCGNINVLNGFIYYQRQQGKYILKRCTLEGKDVIELTDVGIWDYVLSEDTIYYSTDFLQRMDLDGNNIHQLTENGEFSKLDLYGDYIFCTDYTTLSILAVKNDGSEKVLVKENAKGYDVIGDYLYYYDEINFSMMGCLHIPTGEIKMVEFGLLPNLWEDSLYIHNGNTIKQFDLEHNLINEFEVLNTDSEDEVMIEGLYIVGGNFYILYRPIQSSYDLMYLASVDLSTGELIKFE